MRGEEAAKLLLGAGAHLWVKDAAGRTPLLLAAEQGRTSMVEILTAAMLAAALAIRTAQEEALGSATGGPSTQAMQTQPSQQQQQQEPEQLPLQQQQEHPQQQDAAPASLAEENEEGQAEHRAKRAHTAEVGGGAKGAGG
jgi:ankyrin repeat protein